MVGLNDHFGTKPIPNVTSSLETSVQRFGGLLVLST
jgi:hypothetical protein